MDQVHKAIDAALAETDRLRKYLKRNKHPQVRTQDELTLAKATALAWFNNHRKDTSQKVDGEYLKKLDGLYNQIISATDKATSRSKYDDLLKSVRQELSLLRTNSITLSTAKTAKTSDQPPDFTPLVPDTQMQKILVNRWNECTNCIAAGAPLAATVMMGGLLETLLLARINKEPDKKKIFTANTTPKDKTTGKPLPLKEWTLRHYIDVAHELNWISQSAKDISAILRDYRNYIHPYKELSGCG
jgi:hypothetical protein